MSYKIVVADDSKTTHKVAEIAFESEDYEVHYASNGEEAIKLAEKITPDLVILDVDLPKKNGYQVCKYINENLKEVSVVLLKGAFETIDKNLVEDLIYEDIIPKPFDASQLIERVKEIFEKKSLVEEEEKEQEIMVNPFLETGEEKDIGLPEEMEEVASQKEIPITDELINQVSEMVAQKISPELVKEAVQKIVPKIAEDLIKKEIEKIKKEVESISSS